MIAATDGLHPARACASDLVAGESVIRTFDGDLPVTRIHTTESGFCLVFFPGGRIRPYYPSDFVYLVAPTPEGRAA